MAIRASRLAVQTSVQYFTVRYATLLTSLNIYRMIYFPHTHTHTNTRLHSPTTRQYDKSGRANCKKCKSKLIKGEMRIVTVVPETEKSPYEMKSYHHPRCFGLPRKYATGAHKISYAEFVDTVLEDASEQQEILPSKTDELVELMESGSKAAATATSSSRGRKSSDAADKKESGPIQLIKEAFQARNNNNSNSEEEPSPKKAKLDPHPVARTEPNGADSRAVDAYAMYHHWKTDPLKDLLKWNRQHVTGNKDVLLQRVLDGVVYGRLGRCPLDGGRWKLGEDGVVTCAGAFDDATMTRLECSYKKPAADTPRVEWCVCFADIFESGK